MSDRICPECGSKLPRQPLCLWFMYDCHLFSELPLDPDAAAEKVRAILKEPDGRCGMLCSHQYKVYVHHDWQAPDEKFIEATRAWVKAALAAEVTE